MPASKRTQKRRFQGHETFGGEASRHHWNAFLNRTLVEQVECDCAFCERHRERMAREYYEDGLSTEALLARRA